MNIQTKMQNFLLFFLMVFIFRTAIANSGGMIARSEGLVKQGFGPPVNTSTVFSESLIECQIHCMNNSNCMSFFNNNTTKECAVMDYGFVDGTILQAGADWMYATATHSGCPRGFFYKDTFKICYKLHNERTQMNYTLFKEICYSEGADIIVVDSQELTDHLKDFLKSQTDVVYNFAIQGHWNGTTWVYDDETPVTFFEWAVEYNKPYGNLNTYSQIYILAHPAYKYKWTNKLPLRVTNTAGFICGMKI